MQYIYLLVLHLSLLLFTLNAQAVNERVATTPLILPDGQTVTIETEIIPFNERDHNIEHCGPVICSINQSFFFGSDNLLPKEEIKKITVRYQDRNIELDSSGMFDPLAVNEATYVLKPLHDNIYKLTGKFSDGAGSYCAQWLFSDTASIRTIIGNFNTFDGYTTICSIK